MSKEKQFMTVPKSARALGVTVQAIHNKLLSGRVEGAHKVANRWLIPVAWVKKRKAERELIESASR